jgi:REP element-mobilizing transposase RayT
MSHRRTGKISFSAKYHLIWCLKHHRLVLVSEVAIRLGGFISRLFGKQLGHRPQSSAPSGPTWFMRTVRGVEGRSVRREIASQKLAA